MKTFREILEGVIASPMKVVTVDTPVEFIHFDKMKDNGLSCAASAAKTVTSVLLYFGGIQC